MLPMVLSPPRPVAPEAVDPKRHGLCLRLGDASAVLLPQVARREGWDRARLLAQMGQLGAELAR